VLKKDMVVTGEVVADIFASTSGTDNDIVVKLIDQYPDDDTVTDPKMRGYQLMTNEEIIRGAIWRGSTSQRPCGRVRCMSTSIHCTMWTTSSRRGIR